MSIAIVTGSGGLIGSESVRFLVNQGLDVAGIDNDLRGYFFGASASTASAVKELQSKLGDHYRHHHLDIRDQEGVERLFESLGKDIALVIHTAAQPSHDWAASDPHMDFTINANGTLTLLEAARKSAPNCVFVFTSTNKVYGDGPNFLPLVEKETRWELEETHPSFPRGIDETMGLDRRMHSLFGVSKVAADILVQEYGRYFGMKTVCFRGGCLTGPWHSGAEMHGFLSYLVKCTRKGTPYTVHGYKGKQVRDNIHSADVARAFWQFFLSPKCGAVYNLGGSRHSNCSMIEAIRLSEEATGRKLNWTYNDEARRGDHIWYISDISAFQRDYPGFELSRNVPQIIDEIASFL